MEQQHEGHQLLSSRLAHHEALQADQQVLKFQIVRPAEITR